MRSVALILCLAAPAMAQPRVGLIDTYGERKLDAERIRKALGVQVGDPLPPSKLDLEERLEAVDGVVRAHVEAACCVEDARAILYAGVEERGAPHFEFRLPEEGRDLALPPADDTAALLVASREAAEASVRADATALLGDKAPSREIIEALQYASRDFDPTVRRAALHGLVRMARGIPKSNPEDKLAVAPTWMIEMLNSFVWTDRVNAVEALLALSDSGDPNLIERVQESGFDSLVQMARWKHLPHALPPFLLLARVGGLPNDEAHAAWSAGDREKVISRIIKERKKR